MRLAARVWEEDHFYHLEEAGMVRGKATPTAFHITATGTRCVVHGDDFAFVDPVKKLQRMTHLMKAWYEVLGSGANEGQGHIVVRWKSDSIGVEADSKHRLFGLEDESNMLTATAVKEDVGEDEDELACRNVAARASHLAVDRAASSSR